MQAQYVPSLHLFRTQFLHNINQVSKLQVDDENVTTAELFRSITTSGGLTYFSNSESVELIIDNCIFVNNTAEVDEREKDQPVLLTADGHGGAILVRLSRLTGARIEITNSLFDSNVAGVDGGGIFFSLSGNFSSSNILFRNNTFKNNIALESTGGAISYNIFSFSFNNSMLVESCRFINNSGSAGGAVSVSLYASSLTNVELRTVSHLEQKMKEQQSVSSH